MKRRIVQAHGILSGAFMVIGVLAMIYAYATRPRIGDILAVTGFEVVSLSSYAVDDEDGCIREATERPVIRTGDALFVKVDALFLQDIKERYRTWLRNLTVGRNVYDDRAWSSQFQIDAGSDYCPYQTIEWWVGHPVPSLRPGEYQLFTEYQFETENGRVVEDTIMSKPFVVRAE